MLCSIELILSNKHFQPAEMLNTFNAKNLITSTTQYEGINSIKSTHAKYKNFNFTLTLNRLKAFGSLNKFTEGSNIVNSSYFNDVRAINELENVLEVSLKDAIINRIDIAYNFDMDFPISNYLNVLVTPPSFKSYNFANETKEFRSKNVNLIFYDKVKEEFRRKKTPAEFKQVNLLRYEVRLRKPTLKALGLVGLTMNDLYERAVYTKLIDTWYKYYQDIPKLSYSAFLPINFKKLSTTKECLLMRGINSLDGIAKVLEELEKSNTTSRVKYDIRKYLNRVKGQFILNPKLVEELNQKVEFVYLHI